MTELRVHNFSISLDGYAAGPLQGLDHPLGRNGERLHDWMFPPGDERTPVDEAFVERGQEDVGATVIGVRTSLSPPLAGSRRAPEGGHATTSSC